MTIPPHTRESNEQDGDTAEGASRAVRYATNGIRVFVDDWECEIVNVSDTGLLIDSKYLSFESGVDLQFVFIYPTNARPAKIVLNGVVVRANNTEFAVENIRPTVTWRRLLQKHLNAQGAIG